MAIRNSDPSTWTWPEVGFLAAMMVVGFWLLWLELAMRVGATWPFS